MSKAAIKAVFKAKDGSDHLTKQEAQKRNDLLVAEYELRQQVERVAKLIGDAALTADGEPFETHRWRSYWFIANSYVGIPTLRDIPLYGYDVAVDNCRTDQALRVMVYERHGDEKKMQRFYVHDLYSNKAKAQEAHLKACKERLAQLTRQVEEIELEYKRGQ